MSNDLIYQSFYSDSFRINILLDEVSVHNPIDECELFYVDIITIDSVLMDNKLEEVITELETKLSHKLKAIIIYQLTYNLTSDILFRCSKLSEDVFLNVNYKNISKTNNNFVVAYNNFVIQIDKNLHDIDRICHSNNKIYWNIFSCCRSERIISHINISCYPKNKSPMPVYEEILESPPKFTRFSNRILCVITKQIRKATRNCLQLGIRSSNLIRGLKSNE